MNQFYEKPPKYDFGLSFNYDVWGAGSSLRLCSVPWDSGYDNVVDFGSHGAVSNYISGLPNTYTHHITDLFHIKPSKQYIDLDVPYNQGLRFNYIQVSNPAQPIGGDSGRSFYYFVRDVEYRAPNTTRFHIQLDVWQTYFYDVKVLSGYVIRGHWAVKHANRSMTNPILDIPETIDTGEQYVTKTTIHHEQVFGATAPRMITSVVSLTSAPGTPAQPLNPAAKGSRPSGVGVPTESYMLTEGDFTKYISAMSKYPWIMAGMVRACIVPNRMKTGSAVSPVDAEYPPRVSGRVPLTSVGQIGIPDIVVRNWRDKMIEEWGQYSTLARRYSKVFTQPFTYVEFYCNNGTYTAFNPRQITMRDMNIGVEVSVVPWAEAIMYHLRNLNYSRVIQEAAMTIRNFPTVPVLNNNGLIAQAGSARSVQAARMGASWAESRAIAGANNAYSNMSIGVDAAREGSQAAQDSATETTAYTNQRNQQGALVNAISSTAAGAGMGAFGGPAGAIVGGLGGAVGGVSGMIGASMNSETATNLTAMSNAAAANQMTIATNATVAQGDNNRKLAMWGAQGDKAQAIAAIDAKVQETLMTPHSLGGAIGGEMEMVGMPNTAVTFTVRVKAIDDNAKMRVLNMFARFGYQANVFTQINTLNVMTQFSYWQFSEVFLDTSKLFTNEMFANALKGILVKGVTVYTSPAFIGKYDFEGNEIA